MSSVFRRFGLGLAIASLSLAACGGGGGGGGSSLPAVSPTPFPSTSIAPTSPPTIGANSVNAACLVFGGVNGLSSARSPQSVALLPHRMPARAGAPQFRPGLLTVTYKRGASPDTGLRSVGSYRLADRTADVVQVNESSVDSTMAALRARPEVASVERVAVRYAMSAPRLLTNDPYFSQPPNSIGPQPGPPCYEAANIPGQWDMHQIGLDFAFGYTTAANSLGVANPNAAGNPGVKIAIVDTGADVTHPDLAGGKIVLGKCFITNSALPAGTGCASATDIVDYDGHGTNVAGIAAADSNNSFGFVGAGGNVSLMIYRIFPQPPSVGCPNPSNANDPQCGANDVDEAAAINDAVSNGAKVISLSLGSGTPSATEQGAINAAIGAGVTVVAASGNESASKLDYPAGYAGVIAVGATSINDSNPAQPFEYVAKYSNYNSSSPAAWGIVAPGGDPSSDRDLDNLHWIENLYSSSAVTNPCPRPIDLFGEANNCRILIAGTSQATPHVAGAVGLLLSVKPGLTPAQVQAALQASAHNIGDPRSGYGRLNVYRLIGTALGDSNLPAQ